MTLPLDTIVCGDNVAVMSGWPDACIDLTVTSPPYDNLRTDRKSTRLNSSHNVDPP
jgi:DNA modification methylase